MTSGHCSKSKNSYFDKSQGNLVGLIGTKLFYSIIYFKALSILFNF